GEPAFLVGRAELGGGGGRGGREGEPGGEAQGEQGRPGSPDVLAAALDWAPIRHRLSSSADVRLEASPLAPAYLQLPTAVLLSVSALRRGGPHALSRSTLLGDRGGGAGRRAGRSGDEGGGAGGGGEGGPAGAGDGGRGVAPGRQEPREAHPADRPG